MTTNVSPDSPLHDPNAPPPRRSAILGVVLTCGLTVLLLGLLFYRSVLDPVPSSRLIVRGDSSWQGVRVTVEGPAISEPRTTLIDESGRYVVPFFLPPGLYTLRVTGDERDLYTRQVELADQQVKEINLPETGSGTRPATTSSVLVEGGDTIQP